MDEKELDELRIKIAKLKGWKFGGIDNRENSRYWVISPNGSTVVDNSSTPENAWICAKIHDVPNWPRDIADAWELVEESMNVLVQTLNAGQPVPCWLAQFWVKGLRCFEASGETAPEAICRAYLAWREDIPD